MWKLSYNSEINCPRSHSTYKRTRKIIQVFWTPTQDSCQNEMPKFIGKKMYVVYAGTCASEYVFVHAQWQQQQ